MTIAFCKVITSTNLRNNRYGKNQNRGYKLVDLEDREIFWTNDYQASSNPVFLPGTVVRITWNGSVANFEGTNLTEEQVVDMYRGF